MEDSPPLSVLRSTSSMVVSSADSPQKTQRQQAELSTILNGSTSSTCLQRVVSLADSRTVSSPMEAMVTSQATGLKTGPVKSLANPQLTRLSTPWLLAMTTKDASVISLVLVRLIALRPVRLHLPLSLHPHLLLTLTLKSGLRGRILRISELTPTTLQIVTLAPSIRLTASLTSLRTNCSSSSRPQSTTESYSE